MFKTSVAIHYGFQNITLELYHIYVEYIHKNKNGKLKPKIVDKNTGYRYYTERQLKEFYGEVSNKERLVLGYCRVSSEKQKEALERQIENVRTY